MPVGILWAQVAQVTPDPQKCDCGLAIAPSFDGEPSDKHETAPIKHLAKQTLKARAECRQREVVRGNITEIFCRASQSVYGSLDFCGLCFRQVIYPIGLP